MIHDPSRAGWFGASDVSYIMGNWKTKSFRQWWMKKLGIDTSHFTTRAMNAGTYYEGVVLDYVGAPRRDHQILLPDLLLRVNLDGDGPGRIWEVKTHGADKAYKPTKAHRQQVQVQMFAKMKTEGVIPNAEIVDYGLTENDYRNFFNEIDPGRVGRHVVSYDQAFLAEFLEKLEYLRDHLKRGMFP